MKKLIVPVVASLMALPSFAATYTVASGDVTSLTNLLATYTSRGNVIELEAGDYDLTGIEMKSGSHLYHQRVTLRGKGATPWDTRLIGDGTARIILDLGYEPEGVPLIENLTLTNGYAKSGSGGGVNGVVTIKDCVVIGCRADVDGGAGAGGVLARNCKLFNNSAKGSGGAMSRPNAMSDCEVVGNTAGGNGGAVYSYDAYPGLSGNVMSNNVAQGSGGAVCNCGVVTNCVIVCNKAGGQGGGLYLGLASMSASRVVDSAIAGNYAKGDGGGAYCRALDDCEIHDNYSLEHGGGLCRGVARHCVISNNITGASSAGASYLETHAYLSDNTYRTGLEYCDVSGSSLKSGYGLGCTIHDIMKSFTLKGNPHAGEVSKTSGYVWAGNGALTNCLVVNNGVVVQQTRTLFNGGIKSLVNCTLVNNYVTRTFHYADNPANPVVLENCILYGNKFAHYSNAVDLTDESWAQNCKLGGVVFKNTSYGSVNAPFAAADGSMAPAGVAAGYNAYRYGYDGIGTTPLFDSASAWPYSLAKRSTLRGKGVVEDWMATAYDIRGEGYSRVFRDVVDLGCYQSRFRPRGFIVSVQ